jgi:hypothetical protein
MLLSDKTVSVYCNPDKPEFMKPTLLLRKFFLLKFFILLILSFTVNSSKATHMAGADLTYEYLGNNSYLVTYTFYRDCIGIPAPQTATLEYGSLSCGFSDIIDLFPVPGTGQQISYVCPGAVTTCDGGNDPGIQEWEYTGIVTLNQLCPDWTFGVAQCCRNAAITTIQNPLQNDLYLEATLNNTVAPNNSPVFSNVPIAFECIGQNNYYNHGGIDADGDSLVYSFVAPLNAPNDPLQYFSGYSLANPITSTPAVSINQISGDVFMHPTAPEVGVIAVRIDEYRNGVLIGTVVRDIQIYVVQCNNILPLMSGINGTNVFSYAACQGGPICFNLFSSDLDAGDSLTVTWNQGIPAASFNTNSAQFPTGQFCWTPTAADVRPQPYFFTVTVHDNACPSNGVQTFSYSIQVSAVTVTMNNVNVSCNGGHNGTATALATGTTGGLQYFWLPGELTTQSIGHLFAGTYTVNILDSLGCVAVGTVTITQPPAIAVSVTGQNASCSGGQGSATVTATGGTGNFTYLWNNSQTTQTITGISAGTYTVVVRDGNNCPMSGSTTITGTLPFTANISSTPATCNASNGSASVSLSGGSGNYSFAWTPNISSDSIATGLTAGSYSVIVTDNGSGCVQTLSTIVQNNAGITASIVSSSPANCQNGEDGMATASGSGGTAPYFYLWSPGNATTASVSNLSPGTYTVMVSDYNNCPDFATVTIGYLNPAPVVNLGPDTTLCIGTSYTMDAGPGYASYLWSDNSTSQTLTVSISGNYSVFVTDSNGCENLESIHLNFVLCPLPAPLNVRSNALFSVYPNPVTKIFTLNMVNKDRAQLIITITDVTGRTCISLTESTEGNFNHDFDMSLLKPGIYYLDVSVNGEENHRVSLVKM